MKNLEYASEHQKARQWFNSFHDKSILVSKSSLCEKYFKNDDYENLTSGDIEYIWNKERMLDKNLIQLDKNEKIIILICKGHLRESYGIMPKSNIHEIFIKYWIETYAWNPLEDNNYKDYLKGLFRKLLSIHLRIKEEWSNPNAQLEQIFDGVFNAKNLSPIEAGIKELISLISYTAFMNEDGTKRFNLDIDYSYK